MDIDDSRSIATFSSYSAFRAPTGLVAITVAVFWTSVASTLSWAICKMSNTRCYQMGYCVKVIHNIYQKLEDSHVQGPMIAIESNTRKLAETCTHLIAR